MTSWQCAITCVWCRAFAGFCRNCSARPTLKCTSATRRTSACLPCTPRQHVSCLTARSADCHLIVYRIGCGLLHGHGEQTRRPNSAMPAMYIKCQVVDAADGGQRLGVPTGINTCRIINAARRDRSGHSTQASSGVLTSHRLAQGQGQGRTGLRSRLSSGFRVPPSTR